MVVFPRAHSNTVPAALLLCLPPLLLPPLALRERTPMGPSWGTLYTSRLGCYSRSFATGARRLTPAVRPRLTTSSAEPRTRSAASPVTGQAIMNNLS